MLNFPSHGANIVPDDALEYSKHKGRKCVSEVCGFAPNEKKPDMLSETGQFAYLFPDAPQANGSAKMVKALDALGAAMVDMTPSEHENSQIAPVFTYWGQFIDHDITAAGDLDPNVSDIVGSTLNPFDRHKVAKAQRNMRAGALNLDSLYGDGPMRGEQSRAFADLLRFPGDRAKMWIGTLFDVDGRRVKPPEDPGADLLRMGRVLDVGAGGLTENKVKEMDGPFKDHFVDGASINRQRAMIGDARNDENLLIAQLHLAFLRFHNRVVDSAHRHGGPIHDREALFIWARERVSWHYQWLVINEYLMTICDPAIVAKVLANGAPLYSKFFDDNLPSRDDLMPVPLEFAVAAYRFGHSQVRASYDWNEFFGRPDDEPESLNRAGFDLMFRFTGGGRDPGKEGFPLDPMFGLPRLPSDWPADWARLSGGSPKQFSDRAARKIDTNVAVPLANLTNDLDSKEHRKFRTIFEHLMVRNLRRGVRMNVASAQDCIASINTHSAYDLPILSEADLTAGRTGQAVRDGHFIDQTPLWFYILKEAEMTADGEHLGPLGSTLVAETIIGLIIKDRRSYWHQAGTDDGRWHPADGVKPEKETVDSLQALLRAALVL